MICNISIQFFFNYLPHFHAFCLNCLCFFKFYCFLTSISKNFGRFIADLPFSKVLLETIKSNDAEQYALENLLLNNEYSIIRLRVPNQHTILYCAFVWDPQTAVKINRLEGVQRRATQFGNKNFFREVRVIPMLQELNWTPINERRVEQELRPPFFIKYKALYNLIDLPTGHLAGLLDRFDIGTISSSPLPEWILTDSLITSVVYYSSLEFSSNFSS